MSHERQHTSPNRESTVELARRLATVFIQKFKVKFHIS